MQNETGVPVFNHRHYVTAEHDQAGISARNSLYTALRKSSVSVDIRNFKKKSVTCPSKSCVYNSKTFDMSVQ